jgi:hypothetical protein
VQARTIYNQKSKIHVKAVQRKKKGWVDLLHTSTKYQDLEDGKIAPVCYGYRGRVFSVSDEH